MNITEALIKLRNDLKSWVQMNLRNKIDKEAITYGTADLTAGSSPLETGSIYIVYE